jgi:hypothetical protein
MCHIVPYTSLAHNNCIDNQKLVDTIAHASQQMKQQQPYITGGGTFKCEYHPRTKIPTISCLTANTAPIQHVPSPSMAQQPNHKGRKRVIFHDTHQITTPAAYTSNLNTTQQELLRLHETYAHADMKEIQQKIKNCNLKAHMQVATCHIPK